MARKLLTHTRAQWAKKRAHDGTMRGEPLRLPVGVAARYDATLQRVVKEMCDTTARELTKLFKHPDVREYLETFGMDISPASQARILTNALKQKFQSLFASVSDPAAQRMAAQANSASAASAYNSLKTLSGGLSLKTSIVTGPMSEFMKATVAQNVSLIRSIPSEYFRKIQGEVLRSVANGKGLQDLIPFFEDQKGITERRARMIAYDQTNKTYNGLNKGRMQAVGVKEFEWLHSGGSIHPRLRHIELSGKTFRFDDLPVIEDDGERGIPGQAINCHCTMIPVIRFEGGEAQV